MTKTAKKTTEQITIRDGTIKLAAKKWFAGQSREAKLTAVLLFEMIDPDRGNNELAEEILDQYRKELLSPGNLPKEKSFSQESMKGALLCILAKE